MKVGELKKILCSLDDNTEIIVCGESTKIGLKKAEIATHLVDYGVHFCGTVYVTKKEFAHRTKPSSAKKLKKPVLRLLLDSF